MLVRIFHTKTVQRLHWWCTEVGATRHEAQHIHIGTWPFPKGRRHVNRTKYHRCTEKPSEVTYQVKTCVVISKENASGHPHQKILLICVEPYKTNMRSMQACEICMLVQHQHVCRIKLAMIYVHVQIRRLYAASDGITDKPNQIHSTLFWTLDLLACRHHMDRNVTNKYPSQLPPETSSLILPSITFVRSTDTTPPNPNIVVMRWVSLHSPVGPGVQKAVLVQALHQAPLALCELVAVREVMHDVRHIHDAKVKRVFMAVRGDVQVARHLFH